LQKKTQKDRPFAKQNEDSDEVNPSIAYRLGPVIGIDNAQAEF